MALGAIVAVAITGGILYIVRFTDSTQTSAAPPKTLVESTWTLTRLVVNGQEYSLAPHNPATLRFQQSPQQFTGSDGCNAIGGFYSLNGSYMRFGDLRSTLIGCLDNTVANQENQFMQGLSEIASYQISGATLTLASADGQTRLTFHVNL